MAKSVKMKVQSFMMHNVNDHRAAAIDIVSKSRAARGSVCVVLLSGGLAITSRLCASSHGRREISRYAKKTHQTANIIEALSKTVFDAKHATANRLPFTHVINEILSCRAVIIVVAFVDVNLSGVVQPASSQIIEQASNNILQDPIDNLIVNRE